MSTLTDDFMVKLGEIERLLAEAYEHYFKFSDGHCKSSEGAISIHFPPYFWSYHKDDAPSVEIYSYVLGPHRSHYFNTIEEALAAVIGWHASEMAHRYDEWGDVL